MSSRFLLFIWNLNVWQIKILYWNLYFQVIDNKIDCNCICFPIWNYDVSIFHCGFNKLIITCFYKSIVLSKHRLDCPSSFWNISLDSSCQSNIIISQHEYLQIHKISKSLLIKCHYPFKYHQGLTIYFFKLIFLPII